MNKRDVKVKKKDLLFYILFSICIALFFLSEFKTSVSFINEIFGNLERIKVKYIFSLFCSIVFLININYKNEEYENEFKRYIIMIIVLFLISLFLQLLNGFHIELFNEIMYLLTPLILSYSIIKYKNGNIEDALNIIYFSLIILFILINISNLSLKSVMSIDFVTSYSPYESGIAFYSIILFIYYLFNNKKKRAIISFILCVLSFKRITFLFLFIFLFLKKYMVHKKPNYKWLLLFFVLIPIILVLLCNDSVSNFFYTHTGIDLNYFMKGRFEFIRILSNSNDVKYGLGSARKVLSEYYINYYSRIGYNVNFQYFDPHCDLLRFYLECGIPGLFVIIYTYLKNANKSSISLYIISYVFVEAIFNHVFGAGNTMYWVLIYLTLYYFNYNFKNINIDNDKKTQNIILNNGG